MTKSSSLVVRETTRRALNVVASGVEFGSDLWQHVDDQVSQRRCEERADEVVYSYGETGDKRHQAANESENRTLTIGK